MSAPRKTAVKRKFGRKSVLLIGKSQLSDIKQLAVDVVKSKKQCNRILELFKVMNDTDAEDLSLACIRANHKVFCFYLESNGFQKLPRESEVEGSSEVKIRQWLRERYAQSISLLLEYLTNDSSAVRELALCTLMKYIEAEGKKPLECSVKSQAFFPASLFEKVVSSLLTSEENQEELIGRFQEYLEYDDIRYNYMKHLLLIIRNQEGVKGREDDSSIETALTNILNGILTLSLPETSEKLTNYLVHVPTVSTAILSAKVQRETYSKLWMSFFKIQLTSGMYKKIMIALPDKVIPYLHNPLIVSDWLISCYDRGGAVSLMALNGLFVLMTKYNLEYPDFYTKLYNIMDNEIFSAKYKARFFHLLDIFLQSLLLPMSIIAAFIKKLSRMALTAPVSGTLLVIELIINLLVRHDTCRALVHREQPCSLESDPYDPDETDISRCHATESSLWEIKTLQKHWHHRVSTQASRIEKPLPQMESVLDELLETNYNQLMEKEIRKSKKVKVKEATGVTVVPINHQTPSKLLQWESPDLNALWTICDE